MSLPAEKLHPWIDEFLAADPGARVGLLDKLLSGIADIPPYGRGLPSDTAVTLFRPASMDAVKALDEALAGWFAERRAWTAERRRTYGLERFIADLDQGLALVGAFDLPKSSDWIRAHFFDLMRWAESISKDPAWRLDLSVARARAQNQTDASMRHCWLRLSEESAAPSKRPLLDAALLGLARLPDRPPGIIPPDIVVGLARWARRLPAGPASQTAFGKRWRAFKARYPAAGQTWRDLWLTALERDRKADPPPSYVEWLADLEPGLKKPRGRAVAYQLPEKREVDAVLSSIGNEANAVTLRTAYALIERFERNARATGDAYYLVRSATNFAGKLLNDSPSDCLALAERALAWEPNNAHAWSVRGRALQRLGHSGLAELVLWEAARRLPAALAIRVDLAALRATAGAPREADRLLRDAHAANPDDEPSAVELARLLAREGRTAEAERLLRGVHAANPEKEHSTVELARLLARDGRLNEALNAMQAFVREHSDHAVAIYTLAELRIAAGFDARDQAAAYRKAFGVNSSYQTLERLIGAGDRGRQEATELLHRPPELPAVSGVPMGPPDDVSLGDAGAHRDAFERIGAAIRAELLLRIETDEARQAGRSDLEKMLQKDDDDLLAHTAYALHDAPHRQSIAGRLNDFPQDLALRLALGSAANGSVDWGALRRAHVDQLALIDLAYLVSVDASDEASRNRLAALAAAEATPTAGTPAAALVLAVARRTDLATAEIAGDRREGLAQVVAAGVLSAVEVDESVVPLGAAA